MDWYLDARFGTSIHWGLYSIAGRGEWVRSVERQTVEQYLAYFDCFRPRPGLCRQLGSAGQARGFPLCHPHNQASRRLLSLGFETHRL